MKLPVEVIDDKVMREFISWRRDYYASAQAAGAVPPHQLAAFIYLTFPNREALSVVLSQMGKRSRYQTMRN